MTVLSKFLRSRPFFYNYIWFFAGSLKASGNYRWKIFTGRCPFCHSTKRIKVFFHRQCKLR